MIEIKKLAKKFTVENPKKLSEQEKKDPRQQDVEYDKMYNNDT